MPFLQSLHKFLRIIFCVDSPAGDLETGLDYGSTHGDIGRVQQQHPQVYPPAPPPKQQVRWQQPQIQIIQPTLPPQRQQSRRHEPKYIYYQRPLPALPIVQPVQRPPQVVQQPPQYRPPPITQQPAPHPPIIVPQPPQHRPSPAPTPVIQPQPQPPSHPNKENVNFFAEPVLPTHDGHAVTQDDSWYTALRAKANAEGDAMARCFQESQTAFTSGDHARAKDLSNQGKMHKAEMERLHREASDLVFQINNKDRKPNEVDLHGLYVKEAIQKTEEAIIGAQIRGDYQLRLIVGKGIHSQGDAKVKPAIEQLVAKYHLAAALDPQNAGVLVVTLKEGGAPAVAPRAVPKQVQIQPRGKQSQRRVVNQRAQVARPTRGSGAPARSAGGRGRTGGKTILIQ
ncbi:hypothetical protein FRB94_013626 [Tulasnella sp. JGI-2019a]|nr:hypothetical protein FRB94_013626 [Tulasnella sp. JGI-2019a]